MFMQFEDVGVVPDLRLLSDFPTSKNCCCGAKAGAMSGNSLPSGNPLPYLTTMHGTHVEVHLMLVIMQLQNWSLSHWPSLCSELNWGKHEWAPNRRVGCVISLYVCMVCMYVCMYVCVARHAVSHFWFLFCAFCIISNTETITYSVATVIEVTAWQSVNAICHCCLA